MNNLKIKISLFFVFVLSLMMSGCATVAITGSADVNKNAFGKDKKYAVVSIASVKTFQGEKGMVNMFKSMEEIPGTDTQPIIDKLNSKIVDTLNRSKYFNVLPEKTLLSNAAYKNMAEDEKFMKVLFMKLDMNAAKNYKYFSDEKKYAQLATNLGVDGVIGFTFNFSVAQSKGGFNINGISFGKKSYSAMTSVTAVAYNRKGEVVWKDSTLKEAEPGDTKAIIIFDTSDITGTSFEKFHPSALEMASKGVDVLMTRFDDTMAGKGASMFQSVK